MVSTVSYNRGFRYAADGTCRPQYALFNLDRIEVQRCLDMIGRGLIVFNWLATAAREELMRFREFISWVRHGKGPGFLCIIGLQYCRNCACTEPSSYRTSSPNTRPPRGQQLHGT